MLQMLISLPQNEGFRRIIIGFSGLRRLVEGFFPEAEVRNFGLAIVASHSFTAETLRCLRTRNIRLLQPNLHLLNDLLIFCNRIKIVRHVFNVDAPNIFCLQRLQFCLACSRVQLDIIDKNEK